MYKIIAGHMTVSSVIDLYNGVKDEKYTVIGDRTFITDKVAKACGAMRVAGERFYGFPLAFITAKDSPYSEAISVQ